MRFLVNLSMSTVDPDKACLPTNAKYLAFVLWKDIESNKVPEVKRLIDDNDLEWDDFVLVSHHTHVLVL